MVIMSIDFLVEKYFHSQEHAYKIINHQMKI